MDSKWVNKEILLKFRNVTLSGQNMLLQVIWAVLVLFDSTHLVPSQHIQDDLLPICSSALISIPT